MRLPSILKKLREAKGLSKAALAETVGVAPSTLQSWETAEAYRRRPSPRNLEALLLALEAGAEDRAAAWSALASDDALVHGNGATAA